MCKISEKQLMQAVKDLKSWCKQHHVLVGECKCPFGDGGVCSISDVDMPCEIKIPCRWTEEEYKLAKLAKTAYVSSIVKPKEDTSNLVKWEGYDSKNKEYSGCFPEGFFESLNPGERVHLCDIVFQYEECNNI